MIYRPSCGTGGRSSQPIFDDAVRDVRNLIEHPAETMDYTHEQQSKAEWERRRNELKDYALSLKQDDGAGGQANTQ
jgi:hypothetical protein